MSSPESVVTAAGDAGRVLWGKLGGTVLAGGLTALAIGVALLAGEPLLMVGLAALPLATIVVVTRPLLLALIFISFAYFRLHECYAPLIALKIPLFTAIGAIVGLVWRSFVATGGEQPIGRPELRGVTLLSASATLVVVALLSPSQLAAFDRDLFLVSLVGTTIMMAVMLACWHAYLTPRGPFPWNNELTLFCVFFFQVSLGTGLASQPQLAYAAWDGIWWKIGLMTIAIAMLVRSPADFSLVARFIVASGIVVALTTIKSKLQGVVVEGSRAVIMTASGSVLGDPNDLALILLFPLAFAAALVIYRPSRVDLALGLVAVPPLLLAIVFTQSRGGLIGVLVVLAVVGYRAVRSWTVVLGIGALAAMALYGAMDIDGRASGGVGDASFLEHGLDESSYKRLLAWDAAFKMAVAHPLTGVGMDNFSSRLLEFAPEWRWPVLAPHSTWFTVLAATGFSGLVIFLLMIAATFRSSLRSWRTFDRPDLHPMLPAMSLALVAGLAGFCASGTFLTQAFTWPLYMLVGLTCALGRYADRERLNTP